MSNGYTTTTTILRPFFQDHPGEPVPEENFWTLLCRGRLTKEDTPTIWLGATPSGVSSAHLHHPPVIDIQPVEIDYVQYAWMLSVNSQLYNNCQSNGAYVWLER